MAIKDERIPNAPVGLVKRADWYHYIRTFKGKTVKKALKTKNFAQAVRMCVELNEQIEDKKVSPVLAVNKDSYDFAYASKAFLATKQLRPKSLKRYSSTVGNINSTFELIMGKPSTPLSEVNRSLIQDYAQHRKTALISPNGHPNAKKVVGVSDKTLKFEVDYIKGVLKYAVGREWLHAVPNLDGVAAGKKRNAKKSERAEPFSQDELASSLSSRLNMKLRI